MKANTCAYNYIWFVSSFPRYPGFSVFVVEKQNSHNQTPSVASFSLGWTEKVPINAGHSIRVASFILVLSYFILDEIYYINYALFRRPLTPAPVSAERCFLPRKTIPRFIKSLDIVSANTLFYFDLQILALRDKSLRGKVVRVFKGGETLNIRLYYLSV